MNNQYNWKNQREKNALLALEDGTVYYGFSVGAETDSLGEVVFNTGMTGYQEIISDPSYAGQIVTMSYPEIGNTGINYLDFESCSLSLSGLIISNINTPSSWRSDSTLSDILKQENIPAIAGIDTRCLIKKIRESGTLKGFIHCSNVFKEAGDCIDSARSWCGLDNQDYAQKVSCSEDYHWEDHYWEEAATPLFGVKGELPKPEYNIVAYDFGIKWSILRQLRINGFNVHVVPAWTEAEKVLQMNPDGVFLSNGPADPAAVGYAIENTKQIIGKVPIMGICLGHQILSIACGCKTGRLKFGHHGCNHPVKNLLTGQVEITSQNHNFAVKKESLSSNVELTHINLNDDTVEGIKHKNEPLFSVQYHPEAAPGPHDSTYLFKQFKELIGS